MSEHTKCEVEAGRAHIARLAKLDGEHAFAAEVLTGCWDHRSDVARAISGERFKPRLAP